MPYTFVDRLLHRAAFSSPLISEMIFDIEKNSVKPQFKQRESIYVTGLARSGTTVLMRALYSTNRFASLTYNDMPFVMAPNLWGKLAGLHPKGRTLQERAHGDGIQVDFDSPEAFEEVFWKIYCGNEYIEKDLLKVHAVKKQVLLELHKYHDLICHKYSKPRYLAKNNNFMLRISSVSDLDPSIKFLVMYRNPIDHAKSLLNQHKRFDNVDSFTQNYMNWLVHHEFGSVHRPFWFDNSNIFDNSINSMDYWLQRWVDAYTYFLQLLQAKKPNIIPISYEKICNDLDYWPQLCDQLSLERTKSPFRQVKPALSSKLDSDLIKQAFDLYQKIDAFDKA